MPVKDLTVSGSPELNEKNPQENRPPERPQKVGFVSLGCPKNLVDSEVMMGLLARAGAELTRHAEDADIIVVNTCSFIDSAQQESVNTILEMARPQDVWKGQETRRRRMPRRTFPRPDPQRISPKSTPSSALENWSIFSRRLESPRPQ